MPKLLLLGDSHAGGLKPHVTRLARQLGWDVEVHFKNGLPTSRLSELLVPGQLRGVDLVVLVSGTNDSAIVGEPGYAGLVESLVRAFGGGARRVSWWGPPHLFREDLAELPGKVTALAMPAVARGGGSYVDGREYTGGSAADYDAAGVHPRREYAAWAEGALGETLRGLKGRSSLGKVFLGVGAGAALLWLLVRS